MVRVFVLLIAFKQPAWFTDRWAASVPQGCLFLGSGRASEGLGGLVRARVWRE